MRNQSYEIKPKVIFSFFTLLFLLFIPVYDMIHPGFFVINNGHVVSYKVKFIL